MPIDDDDPNSLPKSKSRADRLTELLLEDRAKQAERQQGRQQERQRDKGAGIGFDPHMTTGWATSAGSSYGYMPRTPMRMGSVGFWVHCKACNTEFESKGWAYCPKCMDLPAEERHAMRPAYQGRICQAPGCESPIPRTAKAGTRYCSSACRQRGARMSRENAPG